MRRDLDYDWVTPSRRAAPSHSARRGSPQARPIRSRAPRRRARRPPQHPPARGPVSALRCERPDARSCSARQRKSWSASRWFPDRTSCDSADEPASGSCIHDEREPRPADLILTGLPLRNARSHADRRGHRCPSAPATQHSGAAEGPASSAVSHGSRRLQAEERQCPRRRRDCPCWCEAGTGPGGAGCFLARPGPGRRQAARTAARPPEQARLK
jgi:hypothetical protein